MHIQSYSELADKGNKNSLSLQSKRWNISAKGVGSDAGISKETLCHWWSNSFIKTSTERDMTKEADNQFQYFITRTENAPLPHRRRLGFRSILWVCALSSVRCGRRKQSGAFHLWKSGRPGQPWDACVKERRGWRGLSYYVAYFILVEVFILLSVLNK